MVLFTAQQCLRATNGDRDLPNFVRPGGNSVPRFLVQPIQAIITSYRFNCCGVVTQWRALVENSGSGHFDDQAYTIFFQVWRPNSLSPVNTDGCYTMQGTNHFPSIPLSDPDTADRGIVTGVPLESERIEVQPGDVVGFYLENSRANNDGIQFARNKDNRDNTSPYTNETVWFATGLLTPRPEATCMYPVGKSRLLNSSTSLAPLITATICEFITTQSILRYLYSFIAKTGCPPRTTKATATPTTTAANSGPTTAADNIGGIAVPVGLVMIAVTITLILSLFVIHKRRAKKHKQSGKIYTA